MASVPRREHCRRFGCEGVARFNVTNGVDPYPVHSVAVCGYATYTERDFTRNRSEPSAPGKMVESHHGAATVSGESVRTNATACFGTWEGVDD